MVRVDVDACVVCELDQERTSALHLRELWQRTCVLHLGLGFCSCPLTFSGRHHAVVGHWSVPWVGTVTSDFPNIQYLRSWSLASSPCVQGWVLV